MEDLGDSSTLCLLALSQCRVSWQPQDISEGRLSKRIRLAFLSPKLVTAILDGTTGQELTIKKLSSKDIPLNWDEQHARFLC